MQLQELVLLKFMAAMSHGKNYQYPSIHPFIHSSIYLSMPLSIHPSNHLSIFISFRIEIRGCMGGIFGTLQLLDGEPNLTPDQQQLIESAQECGQQLLAVVNNM